jgi:hypothetical protein
VACRAGPGGSGPNLAAGLLNVSAGGAGLMLHCALAAGKKVVVFLKAPGEAAICRVGFVRWCQVSGAGLHRVGIQFYRQLQPAELRSLTGGASDRPSSGTSRSA